MKPFDLEAAKGGALFEHELELGTRCKFIGFRENGSIVYEEIDKEEICWAPAAVLRMLTLPKRKIVKYGLICAGDVSDGDLYSTLEHAQRVAAATGEPVARVEWEE